MEGAGLPVLDAFQAGLLIVVEYWSFFLCLGMLQLVFTMLTACLLGKICIGKDVYLVVCFLGGMLGLTLFCFIASILKMKPASLWIIGFAGVALAGFVDHRKQRYEPPPASLLALVPFFLFLLFFRLSFVQNLIVPSYADSVTHIQIVQDLLSPERQPSAYFRFDATLQRYYHFGFHSVAAWLSGVTATDPLYGIMLLGQYFQALGILALFPLGRLASEKPYIAWMAMIIALFFLPMPAYASNWGKYPAIASMAGISFLLTFFLLYLQQSSASARVRVAIALAVVSTVVLHSRSLFVFMLVLFIYALHARSDRLLRYFEINQPPDVKISVSLFMIYMGLLSFFLLLVLESDIHIAVISVLIGFSIIVFFIDTLFALLLVFFLLVGTGILPSLLAEFILPHRYASVFDRPYLVILLYIPVSILIAQGIDKLFDFIKHRNITVYRLIMVLTLFAAGIVYVNQTRNYLPSSCCIFVNDDDLFSYIWMKENIPENALVGIAATGKPGSLLAADGGAWVEHFTSIPTRKLDTSADFTLTKRKLCNDRVTYFYLDDLENSFDENNLIEAGGIHQFSLGDVRIYLLNCDYIE